MNVRQQAATITGLVIAVACAVAAGSRSFSSLENHSFDLRFRLRGQIGKSLDPTGDVIIVALDDDTFDAYPEVLSSRKGTARLLRAIKNAQPTVIGFDGFFNEAEEPLPVDLRDDIDAFLAIPTDDSEARALLVRVHDETDGDAVLEAAIKEARPIVLAAHGINGEPQTPPSVLKRLLYGQSTSNEALGPPPLAEKLLASLPPLMLAATSSGVVSINLDDDEGARRVAGAREHQKALLTPFFVQIVAAHKRVPPSNVGYLPGEAIVIGDIRVPLDEHNVIIPYRRDGAAADPFSAISAKDVLDGKVDDRLRGKIVLVGYSYLTHDSVLTPFGRQSGVNIHAHLIDGVLARDTIRRAPRSIDVVLTLLCGVLMTIALGPLGPRSTTMRVLLALSLLIAVVVSSVVALSYGVWSALAMPLMALSLSGAAALIITYATEGQERRRLRAAFARYVAPDFADEIARNKGALALGGASRDATMLFSDIRGFTTLSESMTPEALTTFLNTYLTPMTEAVLTERGFVDKYIGDAIMAVFGVPAPRGDHHDHALRAAVRMHQALLMLRRTLRDDIACGVGLNSGAVVAGNMGSRDRFDYTVIGDAVNLASRLEGLTKKYGVFCIVGEETQRHAAAHFAFRDIDLVRVKGRTTPARIFELLGDGTHEIVRYVNTALFDDGVVAFRKGDFAQARQAMTAFLDENPSDAVARLYLARLDAAGNFAPEGFDGVFEHADK